MCKKTMSMFVSLLWDRLIEERNGKEESPSRADLVLNNSLCDRFKDTKLGNLDMGGRRVGPLKKLSLEGLFFGRPRKPAVSPIAQFDNLNFDKESNWKYGSLSSD
mmetsp:Transcript_11504/g.23530  ORF Transcript_11504/g.23530 Transcript_11504/m.23530 type:complete len:105 (+) Transcript_11504:1-315(+)